MSITDTRLKALKLSELDLLWRLSASIYVLIPTLIVILSHSIVLIDWQTLRRRSVDLLYWIVVQ